MAGSPHPLISRKYPLGHTALFSHSLSLVCSDFALHGSSSHTKINHSALEDIFRHIIQAFLLNRQVLLQSNCFFQNTIETEPLSYSLKITYAGETLTGSFISSAAVQQCAKLKPGSSLLTCMCIWACQPFITTTTTH